MKQNTLDHLNEFQYRSCRHVLKTHQRMQHY